MCFFFYLFGFFCFTEHVEIAGPLKKEKDDKHDEEMMDDDDNCSIRRRSRSRSPVAVKRKASETAVDKKNTSSSRKRVCTGVMAESNILLEKHVDHDKGQGVLTERSGIV